MPDKTSRNAYTVKRPWTKPLIGDRGGIIGDSFVVINVTVSRERYGAGRADTFTPGVSGVDETRHGEGTTRKEGQRRERDPPTNNRSDQAADHRGYLIIPTR